MALLTPQNQPKMDRPMAVLLSRRPNLLPSPSRRHSASLRRPAQAYAAARTTKTTVVSVENHPHVI